MHHRSLSLLAATLAALSLGAAPALAGEDDDGSDDSAPTQVQQAPAAPTPAPASSASGVTPRGGVATGLGGTAPRDHDALLLGLASGALLLASAAGGLVAGRRGAS
jgi:hypothetical protein